MACVYKYNDQWLSEGEILKVLSERKEFKSLYNNLLNELDENPRAKEVLDRIKRDYVFKKEIPYMSSINKDTTLYYDKNTKTGYIHDNSNPNERKTFNSEQEVRDYLKLNDKYTLEEQQEEAIVELLGLYTANRLDRVKDGKLISLLKILLKEMKAFMRSLIGQKEVEIDKLPDNMTLGDIADLLAYSNSKLILPGNEVIYTTPDNQQFKTYTEASNHISNLAKSVEDVDLSSVSINNIKIDKNNLPSDFKNYYTSNRAEIAFMKDAKYNDEYNNKIQELRDKYAGKFIVVKKSDYGVYPDTTENQNFYNTKEEADNAALDKSIEQYKKEKTINGFIEQNNLYEQSKEIIEEWKRVNNIQYNPEEIYSRGQEFVSVVGAYSDFDVNLMMQNLLQHIEDNQKAGGEFTISAFTKPVDKSIGHLEGGGGKIKFKIYPQPKDILWAANTDVYSGSVWDASEKVNKDKKSELLGVSYTKYPSLQNVSSVQPNLASIIDDLKHHHNELGITLTGSNFRLEYDEDIPYSTKKIINSINSILDQKYGKLVKPEINKNKRDSEIFDEISRLELLKKEDWSAPEWVDLFTKKDQERLDYLKSLTKSGIQPTQTNETLKESIESVKNKIVRNKDKYVIQQHEEKFVIYDLEEQDAVDVFDNKESALQEINKLNNQIGLKEKEYIEQALINTKIAKLKEVAKKYPRSLIRSEVKPINSINDLGFNNEGLPFQKLGSKQNIENFANFVEQRKELPSIPLEIDQLDLSDITELEEFAKWQDENCK